MPYEQYVGTCADDRNTGARYYRSLSASSPVLYVQQEDSWQSYLPGGVRVKKGFGSIPPTTLVRLTEVSEAEAQLLLQPGASSQSQRASTEPPSQVWVPIPPRERVWLVLRGVLMLALLGVVAVFSPRTLLAIRRTSHWGHADPDNPNRDANLDNPDREALERWRW